jgi:thioredoxin-like negative regulator of GroEL
MSGRPPLPRRPLARRAARVPAAVLGLALALCMTGTRAPVAHAADPAPRFVPFDTTGVESRIRILRARISDEAGLPPGLMIVGDANEREPGPVSQHRPVPLTSEDITALRHAQALRLNGQFEQAHAALAPLLAAKPHHPSVVTELTRLLLARKDYAGAERLGRAERSAQRDSLLVTRELSLALERLGRPRDAAAVTLESWLADPAGAEAAETAILRLAPADLHGVRELMRRAAQVRPEREDLALAAAMLDWHAGDLTAALEALGRAERPSPRTAPLRWDFAQELAAGGSGRDSSAAIEALTALAGDVRCGEPWRLSAAQRAWEIATRRDAGRDAAPPLARALGSLPAAHWPVEFVAALARGLREGGHTDEARALLRSNPGAAGTAPQLELEAALTDLRDGPPERALPPLAALAAASPEAAWRFAEALFFAGRCDSALACYQRIAAEPQGAYSGAALERVFLIEDAEPRAALAVFGRIAYEQWRGEPARALALSDSLAAALPRGPLWAQAELLLAAQRDAAGDARGALGPLLAVADSLPEDRLAPVARQRAGDLLLVRLKDERGALAQYEECLARYPRAWNAPEVRRVAERLRRDRRIF